MPKDNRLPRTDIPQDYTCPYPSCTFSPKEGSKAKELSYRNHMAMVHDVYYEKAPLTDVGKKLAGRPRHAVEVASLEELKPWQCVALARHVIQNATYKDIGQKTKHSAEYISNLVKSPAGKAYIAKLEEECKDPVKLVRNLMSGDTINKWAGWQLAWDWAIEEKNYEAIHRMAKDIGLQPAIQQDDKNVPTKIVLNMNMKDLSEEVIDTSFEVVEDAVEDDDELD